MAGAEILTYITSNIPSCLVAKIFSRPKHSQCSKNADEKQSGLWQLKLEITSSWLAKNLGFHIAWTGENCEDWNLNITFGWCKIDLLIFTPIKRKYIPWIGMANEIIWGWIDTSNEIIKPQWLDYSCYNNVAWIQWINGFKFSSRFELAMSAWGCPHWLLYRQKQIRGIRILHSEVVYFCQNHILL